MNIKIHNTLSKKVELFKPVTPGQVGMYHCGPTVYDYAHIGNLRAYLFADIVRRVFEYGGYSVKQVINITDVGHLVSDGDDGEDKMTKALKREGRALTLKDMAEVANFYTEKFIDDLKNLHIKLPDVLPKASEHIKQDIEIISELEKKGFAYKISDGIYFDVSKFKTYGVLGGISEVLKNQNESRVVNPEKHSPADFTLWKFDDKLGWDSPWGKGFPGWHIECSAMSREYLGQPFDIHTGGTDHIQVHHNNEIAQSEAAFGVSLANYWMHSAFIVIDDGKMSKSKGNFYTLAKLNEEAISPIAYRYWLLTSHYRSQVNFTFEAVKSAQNALIKLMAHVSSYPKGPEGPKGLDGGTVIPTYKAKFESYIGDDFNMPKAVALAWDLIKDQKQSDADKKATLLDFDTVFGLDLAHVPTVQVETIPPEVTVLAEAREEARKSKDWKKADALREEIEARGYVVKDVEGGFEISS